MLARRLRPHDTRPAAIDPLESRTLLAAAVVRTISLADQVGYTTTPATNVAADGYGDVYATRTGGDGTANTELVVIPAGGSTPQLLASFGPMSEYPGTTETPSGQLVVDAAGDVFGVTRFTGSVDLPLGEDYTQGTLWELPATFHVVDVLARFYKPETAPRSLTTDKAGDLFGVVDSLLGGGSSVFEYPADETGTVTVPLGTGSYCAAVITDLAGDVFGTQAAADDPTGPFSIFEIPHGRSAPTVLTSVPATIGQDPAGLTLDAAGDLFVTTRQGSGGGSLLELPAGGSTVRLLAGLTGVGFNGKPTVDAAGNVFATADGTTTGTSTLLKLPAGGNAVQTIATFATGDTTDVSADALDNLYGVYSDSTTNQATVYAVSGKATSTPTTTPTPTSTAPATGLAPMVSRSTLPATAVAGTKRSGTVTVSLTNTATTAETGTATVAVYATPAGSAVAAAGVRLATVARRVSLAPGNGTAWTVPVTAASLPAGTYTLLAVATDPAGTVLESTAGPTITVAPAVVSLAATDTAAASAGGWVTLTVALTNAGTIASTGKLTATITLVSDGTAAALSLGTVTRAGVTVRPNGQPVALRLRVRLPAGAVAGTYTPSVSVVQNNVTAIATGTTLVTVTG